MIKYQTPKISTVNPGESIDFGDIGLIFVGRESDKPTVALGRNGIVNLEENAFIVDGEQNDNWCVIYCRVAVALARQGYTVLSSSSKCVVEEFKRYNPDYTYAIIYPTRDNSAALAEGFSTNF